MTRFHAKTLKKLWGRERERQDLVIFLFFWMPPLFLKLLNSLLCLSFQYLLSSWLLNVLLNTTEHLTAAFSWLFSRSFRYFRGRVLQDSIACVVDSLNP